MNDFDSPDTCLSEADSLRYGTEVSTIRGELRKMGWCAICATGEAIHRVAQLHHLTGFPWWKDTDACCLNKRTPWSDDGDYDGPLEDF